MEPAENKHLATKLDVLLVRSGWETGALHPFSVRLLCLLMCSRWGGGGGGHWLTAQLLHTTTHIFHVETGSDLESISDDIPGAAHLTDTFHFLCPCATLSAPVHAQKTLTLPSANTRGI